MGWNRTVWVTALIGLASCQQRSGNGEEVFTKSYSACLRIGPIIYDAHNQKDIYEGSLMREEWANYIYNNKLDIVFRNLDVDDIYDVYCNNIFIGRYAIAPGELMAYRINADPAVLN